MSHLTCVEHKRRIIFTSKATYHRSDGSVCKTRIVQTGSVQMDKTELHEWADHSPNSNAWDGDE